MVNSKESNKLEKIFKKISEEKILEDFFKKLQEKILIKAIPEPPQSRNACVWGSTPLSSPLEVLFYITINNCSLKSAPILEWNYNFSKDDVKKLRFETSFGMMDCKKAQVELNGDFDEAIEILKNKSYPIKLTKEVQVMRCKFCNTKLVSTGKVLISEYLVEMRCPNCEHKYLFEMKEIDQTVLLEE